MTEATASESPGPTEEIRLDVDGHTYWLRPWSQRDGARWLFRLLKVASSAIAVGAVTRGTELEVIGSSLGAIDDDMFEEFAKVVYRQTDVEIDRGKRVELEKVVAVHLRGRHHVLMALIQAHIKREFGGFFGKVPALLGDRAKTGS